MHHACICDCHICISLISYTIMHTYSLHLLLFQLSFLSFFFFSFWNVRVGNHELGYLSDVSHITLRYRSKVGVLSEWRGRGKWEGKRTAQPPDQTCIALPYLSFRNAVGLIPFFLLEMDQTIILLLDLTCVLSLVEPLSWGNCVWQIGKKDTGSINTSHAFHLPIIITADMSIDPLIRPSLTPTRTIPS